MRGVRHRITKALDSPASTGSGKQFNITVAGREKGKERERVMRVSRVGRVRG